MKFYQTSDPVYIMNLLLATLRSFIQMVVRYKSWCLKGIFKIRCFKKVTLRGLVVQKGCNCFFTVYLRLDKPIFLAVMTNWNQD